jgi:hypothetical protein
VEEVVVVGVEEVAIVVRERHVPVQWTGQADHRVPLVESPLQVPHRGIFSRRISGAAERFQLDGAAKLGAKILVSGGGRCNVTHDLVYPRDYFGGSTKQVQRILRTFTVEQTIPGGSPPPVDDQAPPASVAAASSR